MIVPRQRMLTATADGHSKVIDDFGLALLFNAFAECLVEIICLSPRAYCD